MRYVVERIEENIASLEELSTGNIVTKDISEIPFMIVEGDVLIFEENTWKNDQEEKKKRRKIIEQQLENLWKEEGK